MKKYNITNHSRLLPLGACLLAGLAPSAFGLSMTLSEPGFAPLVIEDGSLNDSAIATPGIVSYAGPYGSFIFQGDTGSSKPAVGSSDSPFLGTGNTSLSLSGAGPLTITLTESGFDPGSYDFTSRIDGVMSAHSVQFDTFANGTPLSSYVSGSGPFASGDLNSFFASAVPFNLTVRTIVNQPFGGFTSFDSDLFGFRSNQPPPNVPDAGSTGLMLAIGGFALALRRHRK